MKTIRTVLFAIIIASLASCASAIKFPISEVVPAAVISLETKKLGEYNYVISLNIKNLSSPQRLTPPQKIYVIWAVSESGFIKNVGHFLNENVESISYKSSFPYKPIEVFITAEEEEEIYQPKGIEISRLKL